MTSGHPAHKPAELFRADLISAMKLPDSTPMESGSFLTIKEPWRTEWEKGVQVCVSPDTIPEPRARRISDSPACGDDFSLPLTRFMEDDDDPGYVMYDLDDLDINWLESVNQKRKFRALAGAQGLSEETLREAILTLETKCQQGMTRAVATEEALGIEYDEETACDVCRDPESEEHNDLIFCDMCNVCVHQACYGIQTVPRGEWLCKACSSGEEDPECLLCPNRGGALKRVRPGNTKWAHLSCSLWIPEVRLGNVDKMEPITNIEAVPFTRRNLVCCLCRKKQGACVQCSHPSCHAAYHVTCGFRHNLLMTTKLDSSNTGSVIHESYCPKHTILRRSPSRNHFLSSPHKHDMLNGPTQLVQVQESFHKYASVDDLVSDLKLSPKLSALIYNYWKLKRKSQHNKPLLSHLPIETSLEGIRAEMAAAGNAGSGIDMDEYFLKIVHLRQNLEKARNLVYMVQRRERLKKQLLRNQLEMLELQGEVALESASEETEEVELISVEDREELDSVQVDDDDDDDVCSPPSVRQTRSMTSRSVTVQDSLSPFSNHIDSQPSMDAHTPSLITSSSTAGSCTMNGPTCTNEIQNQRLHVATATTNALHTTTGTVGGVMGGVEHSTIGNNHKDYHGNPNMSCSVPALTNIPITRHLRSCRDPLSATSVGSKVGKQQNSHGSGNNSSSSEESSSSSSLYHVSFHGHGKDSFRLTNSDRTGFVDLAVAAAAISNSSGNSNTNSSGVGGVVRGGGGGGGGHLLNHNGTSLPTTKSKPHTNNLVLRSGAVANLRHRPYSVNHKTATKS